MILITRQEDTFSLFENSMLLLRKCLECFRICFQKTLQLFTDNCLKIQSIVFLELVKTVIQNASSYFNDFSNPLLNQKTLMEFLLD